MEGGGRGTDLSGHTYLPVINVYLNTRKVSRFNHIFIDRYGEKIQFSQNQRITERRMNMCTHMCTKAYKYFKISP